MGQRQEAKPKAFKMSNLPNINLIFCKIKLLLATNFIFEMKLC